MKLGRSFNSVPMWVVLAISILLCSKSDSRFSWFGILTKYFYLLVCRKLTGNIQTKWNLRKWWIRQFRFKPPSTPSSSVTYVWLHGLPPLSTDRKYIRTEIGIFNHLTVYLINSHWISTGRWCTITYQYCYHLNSFLLYVHMNHICDSYKVVVNMIISYIVLHCLLTEIATINT